MFVWFVARITTFLVDVIVWVCFALGVLLGIKLIESSGDYATTILFLLQLLDSLGWLIVILINTQTMLVSVGRCFKIQKIPQEK